MSTSTNQANGLSNHLKVPMICTWRVAKRIFSLVTLILLAITGLEVRSAEFQIELRNASQLVNDSVCMHAHRYPASMKRHWKTPVTRELILEFRRPQTNQGQSGPPVIVAHPGDTLRIVNRTGRSAACGMWGIDDPPFAGILLEENHSLDFDIKKVSGHPFWTEEIRTKHPGNRDGSTPGGYLFIIETELFARMDSQTNRVVFPELAPGEYRFRVNLTSNKRFRSGAFRLEHGEDCKFYEGEPGHPSAIELKIDNPNTRVAISIDGSAMASQDEFNDNKAAK